MPDRLPDTDYDLLIPAVVNSIEPPTKALRLAFMKTVKELINTGSLTLAEVIEILDTFDSLDSLRATKGKKEKTLYNALVQTMADNPHLQGIENNAYFDLKTQITLQQARTSDSILERLRALLPHL
jgi:hypothetical protein